MPERYLNGNPPVPILMRRSARARRISLRVSRLDGRVTLTLPKGVSEAEALAFAESRADWIRGHLAAREEDVVPTAGARIPVEGQLHEIKQVTGRRVLCENGQILVPAHAAPARLRSWLRELARDRLTAASDRHAAALGRSYARITLRDTRSRWGSCSSAGALMYSWRLVMAPPEVLDYVAAHEVAHLVEMNHSPAFWSVVEKLYGPYETQRKWLRSNGTSLHRYRFDATTDGGA